MKTEIQLISKKLFYKFTAESVYLHLIKYNHTDPCIKHKILPYFYSLRCDVHLSTIICAMILKNIYEIVKIHFTFPMRKTNKQELTVGQRFITCISNS